MPFVKRHRTYYKYGTEPNASIVGSPTINDGVVSGFTTANYLTLPESFNPNSNMWEMVFKFSLSNVSSTYTILGANSSLVCGNMIIRVYNSKFLVYLSSNGTTWDIATSTGTQGSAVLSADIEYYVRMSFDGSKYVLSYSENNVDFIDDIVIESSSIVNPNQGLSVGIHKFSSTSVDYPFTGGSIDLTQSYIKINGETWWHGTKDYQINVGGDDDYEDWEQPVLSANDSDPSFIVGASSVFSNNYAAWKSFKRITTDKYSWLSDSVDTLGYPQYYTITTDRPLKVSAVTIKNRSSTVIPPIGVWQASKDNIDWIDIVEFSASTSTSGESWSFEPNETVGYKYHRFKITGKIGTTPYITLGYPTITAKILKKEEDIIAEADYSVVRNKLYQLAKPKRFYYDYSNEHNTTIVGNRAVMLNGVASGFQSNTSINTVEAFAPAAGDTWEMMFKLRTGANVTTQQQFLGAVSGDYGGIEIAVENGKFEWWVGTTSSKYDLASGVYGTYAVLPETDYWVKVVYDGSNVTLYYSLDGVDFIQDIQVATTKTIYATTKAFGCDAGQNEYQWLGSIDFNETYINLNGERWWDITKPYVRDGYWIDEGVASGFSSSQYITVPFLFAEADKPWEAVVKFRTGATLGTAEGTTSVIIGGTGAYKGGICAWINSVGLRVGISSNGSSYNIMAKTTIATGFVADTDYWFKAEFTGAAYKLYHSVDGDNWSEPYVVENSTPIAHSAYLTMGGGYLEGNVNYGTTIVYLNDCYIKSGDRLWWHGTKVVEGDKNKYAFYEDRLLSYVPILKTGKQYVPLFESDVGGTYDVEIPEDCNVRVTMVGGCGACSIRNSGENVGWCWTGGSGAAFIGTFALTKGTYSVTVGQANNNTKTLSGGNFGDKSADDTTIYSSSISGVVTCGGGGTATTTAYNKGTVGAGGEAPVLHIDPLSVQLSLAGNSGNYGTGSKGSSSAKTYQGGASVFRGYGQGQGGTVQEYGRNCRWINGTGGYVRIEVWTQTGNQLF